MFQPLQGKGAMGKGCAGGAVGPPMGFAAKGYDPSMAWMYEQQQMQRPPAMKGFFGKDAGGKGMCGKDMWGKGMCGKEGMCGGKGQQGQWFPGAEQQQEAMPAQFAQQQPEGQWPQQQGGQWPADQPQQQQQQQWQQQQGQWPADQQPQQQEQQPQQQMPDGQPPPPEGQSPEDEQQQQLLQLLQQEQQQLQSKQQQLLEQQQQQAREQQEAEYEKQRALWLEQRQQLQREQEQQQQLQREQELQQQQQQQQEDPWQQQQQMVWQQQGQWPADQQEQEGQQQQPQQPQLSAGQPQGGDPWQQQEPVAVPPDPALWPELQPAPPQEEPEPMQTQPVWSNMAGDQLEGAGEPPQGEEGDGEWPMEPEEQPPMEDAGEWPEEMAEPEQPQEGEEGWPAEPEEQQDEQQEEVVPEAEQAPLKYMAPAAKQKPGGSIRPMFPLTAKAKPMIFGQQVAAKAGPKGAMRMLNMGIQAATSEWNTGGQAPQDQGATEEDGQQGQPWWKGCCKGAAKGKLGSWGGIAKNFDLDELLKEVGSLASATPLESAKLSTRLLIRLTSKFFADFVASSQQWQKDKIRAGLQESFQCFTSPQQRDIVAKLVPLGIALVGADGAAFEVPAAAAGAAAGGGGSDGKWTDEEWAEWRASRRKTRDEGDDEDNGGKGRRRRRERGKGGGKRERGGKGDKGDGDGGGRRRGFGRRRGRDRFDNWEEGDERGKTGSNTIEVNWKPPGAKDDDDDGDDGSSDDDGEEEGGEGAEPAKEPSGPAGRG